MTTTAPSALTEQEKRERIAKHLGWTVDQHGWWSHPTLPDGGGAMTDPPAYFHNYAAIQSAMMTMTDDQWLAFGHSLRAIIMKLPLAYRERFSESALMLRTTEAERAEAFGLALNLWEGEQ